MALILNIAFIHSFKINYNETIYLNIRIYLNIKNIINLSSILPFKIKYKIIIWKHFLKALKYCQTSKRFNVQKFNIFNIRNFFSP